MPSEPGVDRSPTTIQFELPAWLAAAWPAPGAVLATAEERMRLAIDLAQRNVEQGGGGPFGAAVFDLGSGRPIALGVNLVLAQRCSVLHAEIVALVSAQRALGTHDLGGGAGCELVTSVEPCAMCLGAVPWSGVRSLVCGARDEDARAVGFDEGHKPADWRAGLTARGIRVTCDVLRAESAAVLQRYQQRGGVIY